MVSQSVPKIDSSKARRAQLAEDFLFLLYKVIYSGRGRRENLVVPCFVSLQGAHKMTKADLIT